MSTTHADWPDDFEAALAARLDGTATEADTRLLDRAIERDPALREQFLRIMSVHATLAWERSSAADADLEPATPAARPIRLSTGRRRIALAVAAAVLIGSAAVALYVVPNTGQPDARKRPLAVDAEPIGMLVYADAEVIGDGSIANGQPITAQTVRTRSGEAEFMLASGATIRLHGQTQITMHSPMSATLSSGRATFDCPPDAHGFVVHAPAGVKVTDLGTRFSMAIGGDGESRVHVSEGRVNVAVDGNAQEIIVSEGEGVTVRADEPMFERFYHLHAGQVDPTSVSSAWRRSAGARTVAEPGSETTPSGVYDFWAIDDRGQQQGDNHIYAIDLTPEQVGHPWRLVASVRVLDSTQETQVVHVDDGTHRWALWLRRDQIRSQSNRNWIPLATGIDLSDDYHRVEMRYADGRATVLLDGERIGELERSSTGVRGQTTPPQLRFGAGSSGGTGRAHWNIVEFGPWDRAER